MNNKFIFIIATVLAISLWCSAAMAAEKEMLAESWVMTPKAGHDDDFSNALKEHIAHRGKLEDPRKWRVYSPVLGDKLDRYIIRACCFEWKQQDEYMTWSKEKQPLKHWQEKVDQFVHSYAHYMAVVDMENSHWPESVTYNYVGVSDMQVKSGHWAALKEDLKIISDVAKSNNWPYNWGWTYSVGGPRTVSLVIPYANYADMAPPEQKFSELLIKHFGDKDKAKDFMQSWSGHFETSEYQIYRLDTELSMM